jgi:hypothetical protein
VINIDPNTGRAVAVAEGTTTVEYEYLIAHKADITVFTVQDACLDLVRFKVMTNIESAHDENYQPVYRLPILFNTDSSDITTRDLFDRKSTYLDNNLKFDCFTREAEKRFITVTAEFSDTGLPTCVVTPINQKSGRSRRYGKAPSPPQSIHFTAMISSSKTSFALKKEFEYNFIWKENVKPRVNQRQAAQKAKGRKVNVGGARDGVGHGSG